MIDAHDMRRRVGLELGRNDRVRRQHDLAFVGGGVVQDFARGVEQIDLAQAFADLLALGGEEGVGHAAADDQEIDLLGQIAEQLQLGRHLGAADHRRDRAGGLFKRVGQGLDLGLHGAAGIGRQLAREAFGRGVGAMGGGEGVVDIDVAERGHRSDERRVVLFLALVEAGVFQQQHVAVGHLGDGGFRRRPDAIRSEGDRLAEMRRERGGDGLQRIGLVRPVLRAAEMGEQDDLAALAGDFVQRRQDAVDPGGVGHLAVIHRHVEVDADKHALALEFGRIQGAKSGHGGLKLKT